ncbi:hypothetical protein HZF02_24730 [Pseudomonas yamanorum]|nr:hypothetical protein HZF02_24730 [Pseudomonas yamanorum]
MANGAWLRSADANTSAKVTPGLTVMVEEGASAGDSLWSLVTDGAITLGTSALVFEMLAGRTGVKAGTYRSLTVDKYGRATAGANPTTLDGYGITDALTTAQVNSLLTVFPARDGISVVGFAGNDVSLPYMRRDSDWSVYYLQPRLGFNPVEQGGGIGQTANKLKLGWSPVGLKATVDSTDLGNLWYSANFDPSKKADITQVKSMIDAVIGGAPGALDTLQELAAALGGDGNFAASVTNALSGKMPVAGGNYRPRVANVCVADELLGINTQGGYIGWGNNEAGTYGMMQFICNRGLGTGGFMWRSVNSNNTESGPLMTYTYDGTLTVPSLSVSAITSNATVPTQAASDNSLRIANTAHVKSVTAAFVARDWITTVGLASDNPGLPYVRRESTGELVFLQVAKPKDTASFGATGWTKNADTGEIEQWVEVAVGEIAYSWIRSIAWPTAFPNACLRVWFSFRQPTTSTLTGVQAFYSEPTSSGCNVRIDEWSPVNQGPGLVVIVHSAGY